MARPMLAAAVVLAAIAVAFAAPVGPLPGFFIGGEPTAVPEHWPDTSNVDEIQLKVPGTLPRVVTMWVVDYEGDLHVVGSRESGWVRMIGQGAPVEMRLGDRTYAVERGPRDRGRASDPGGLRGQVPGRPPEDHRGLSVGQRSARTGHGIPAESPVATESHRISAGSGCWSRHCPRPAPRR